MNDFERIVRYMRKHWPSEVREEWQVPIETYVPLAERIATKWAESASVGARMIRVAGQSGSGKTTQLLPAVEAWRVKNDVKSVLVAARRFVQFHPFEKQIEAEYGIENLRRQTDEFVTILMFLVLRELIAKRVDIILDVTLLDPEVEEILVKAMQENDYRMLMTMVVVAPEITEKRLAGRGWRHTKKTEEEFVRATNLAINFYAERCPKMRVIMWSAFDEHPIFDGEAREMRKIFDEYAVRTEWPEGVDLEKMIEEKRRYFSECVGQNFE